MTSYVRESQVVNSDRHVIDAHVHVWDVPDIVETPFPYRSATTETLLAEMDDAGVERAVLVQPGVYGDDHTYLRAAMDAHPARFAAVALLDPFSPQVSWRLDELAETIPLRGIRLRLRDRAAYEANDSLMTHDLLKKVAQGGLTLSVLTFPRGLEAINRLARRHPDLRVVVDHLGSPEHLGLADEGYRRCLRDLAETPNIWLKVSGFYSFSSGSYPYRDCEPLVRYVFDRFGVERLIWGSDFPFGCFAVGYGELVRQLGVVMPGISEAEMERVIGGNALRLWW